MSDRRGWRALELGLVAATAAAFLAIPKPPAAILPLAVFIGACTAGWAAYAALRLRADPSLWSAWGLDPTAHLGPIARVLAPLVAAAVALGAGFAAAYDRPLVPPWLWLSLLLYPLWGLVQQWLVQALVVDNARALFGLRAPALVALGAVGFGAVHVSHPPLVAATAALGGVYVLLFQRWPNVWPLAVAHGWLGSLFYPWVLGMNPIEEILGVLGPSEVSADSRPAEITVSAAASLTESLQRVARQWTAAGNPEVVFAFDASSRLAKQIEAGAPVDLFFSADERWMDYLAERGLVDRASRRDVVGNSLVVVVPAGSTHPIAGARDLLAPAVRHVALAGEEVPAGAYARAALRADQVWDALLPKVVTGDNVRTTLAWVASGEADAGFVYATDAAVEPRVTVAWTVPATAHPPIVYPGAVVAGAAHSREATAFLAYCLGPDATAAFRAAGFSTPGR